MTQIIVLAILAAFLIFAAYRIGSSNGHAAGRAATINYWSTGWDRGYEGGLKAGRATGIAEGRRLLTDEIAAKQAERCQSPRDPRQSELAAHESPGCHHGWPGSLVRGGGGGIARERQFQRGRYRASAPLPRATRRPS